MGELLVDMVGRDRNRVRSGSGMDYEMGNNFWGDAGKDWGCWRCPYLPSWLSPGPRSSG